MTDPNDHLEAPDAPKQADIPGAAAAAPSEDAELPVPYSELPRAAVVTTTPVVARPIPILAGRRQFARTTPVVVDRGRASFGLPSLGDRRQLGQIGLVVLMIAALVAVLLVRTGQPESPGLAGAGSPSPHASLRPSPKVSPNPTVQPSSTSGPGSSAPAQSPRPSPSSKQQTYKVKSGDTLSSIAARFHTTAKIIEQINALKSPFVIHPGEVLKVP
jgi:LysM repeat protein